MSDLGSEYGRLLAERDRLIADGAEPSDLEKLLPPDLVSEDAVLVTQATLASELRSEQFAQWLRLIVGSSHGKMADSERLAPSFAEDMAHAILARLRRGGLPGGSPTDE